MIKKDYESYEPRHEKICYWKICQNKRADQLSSFVKLVSAFVFTIQKVQVFLHPKIPLIIFCVCTALFVSDLVRNLEDWFSIDTAHLAMIETDYDLYTIKMKEDNLWFDELFHMILWEVKCYIKYDTIRELNVALW